MRVLVMGGTRFLGVEVVEQLLAAGHDVTVFHRGSRAMTWSRDVRHVIGDRDDPAALEPLARLGLDAVLDLSAYLTSQTELLLDVLGDVPCFVNCSTINVYRPDPVLPWPEDTPYGPHPLWGQYAVNKIGCELALRERRPPGTVTISLRPPLILGPRNYIAREEFVLNRIVDDAEILLSGDGQAVHQYIYLRHAATSFSRALDLALEPGYHAYNIASKRCLTSLEGFVDVCAEVAGRPARTRCVGGGATGEDRPVFNGVDCVFPFTNENTIADVDAAEAAGLIADHLPLRDMIGEAYEALLAEPDRRRWERTEAEQRVLAKLQVA